MDFAMIRGLICWAYRAVLGFVLLCLLLPWVSVTGSSSVSAVPGYFEGGSSSLTVWIFGYQTFIGFLVLALAVVGLIVSFVNIPQLLPKPIAGHEKAAMMVVLAATVCFFSLVAIVTAGYWFGGSESIENELISASSEAGPHVGVIFAFLASGVAVLLGGSQSVLAFIDKGKA